MIRKYHLHAHGTGAPVASLRVSGDTYQVMTGSRRMAEDLGSGSWSRLMARVSSSHALQVSEDGDVPSKTFKLDGGDEIEVSTDGASVALNGKLMADDARLALEGMLESGSVRTVPNL